MAKKTSTIRVFELARELSVTSKDLIAKCEAEGIPKITNHMSTISLGLAATVREWFGGGDVSTITAVETAAPVDLAKVRAKAKKKAPRKKAVAPAEKPVAETPVAATSEAALPAVEMPKAPVETLPPAVAAPSSDGPPPPLQEQPPAAPEPLAPLEQPEPLAPAASAPDTDSGAPPAPGETRVRPNVPSRPEVVKPAGPMLQVPSATRLAGPKIIRVETPEPVTHRRPIDRRPDAIRHSGPRAGRGVGVPGEVPLSPDDKSARPGGRTTRRNKRRTATARDDAGRTGKIGTGTGTGTDQPFNWRTQDLREREARLNRAGGFFKAHRRDLRRSSGGGERAITAAQSGGSVTIAEPITIKDLSSATGVKAVEIVKKLFLAGKPVTVNSVIDGDTATEVMLEYNIELEIIELKTSEQVIEEQFRERTTVDVQPRSPVITILGHVDHGKTSLLDRIRNANVAAGEAGGITQATSAFRVPVHAGDKDHVITFIDTPGHEAFSEMRARGAKVTDIAVLVIAADDGVMPQTIESINHAKAAEVPIVVALNKIDKPEATDTNIQRILGQLAEHELNPTEWGGSTEVVRTSATKGEGIQDLLDALDYQAELLNLTADFGGEAQGTVLEAHLAEGRGPVASILVQQGCLKRGDVVVVGRGYGRVRDIMDDQGKRGDEALPSSPVTISGINEVPDAGDNFYVVKNIRAAEAAAAERINREREKELAKGKISLENIFEKMKGLQSKQLPLVVKADVRGSVDVVAAALADLSTDDITISIKHAAVGGINESDVVLAQASGAIVIGFNVTSSLQARRVADARSTEIRLYDVIYDVIDDVRKAAEGLLDPELKLEVLGHAEVREVFKISKVGMVAGCYVTDGVILRNAQIRVTREDIVIEKDRRLNQLRRFKDDAKEARSGQECGMKIDGYDDIKVGDVLECYKTLVVPRKL
ncbi:MAG: translation initiation factor IF-2 [Planctomycetota bacterium]|nr:MAG: translation initiation factor IF-2 [Planctomycetota bacterium]